MQCEKKEYLAFSILEIIVSLFTLGGLSFHKKKLKIVLPICCKKFVGVYVILKRCMTCDSINVLIIILCLFQERFLCLQICKMQFICFRSL